MMEISNRKQHYFDLARKIARLSTHKFKHGALILRGNRVVSLNHNKATQTHPKANSKFNTLHAEAAAILSSKADLKGTDLYVVRVVNNGDTAESKPCRYCQQLIKESGIKRVYYSSDNGYRMYKV